MLLVCALGAAVPMTASAQTAFPESPHPYPDSYDNTWTYTFASSVSAINVTFDSRTWVEAGWDFIYVMDANGNNIPGSPFTGTSLAGQTKQVGGRTVRIRLTTDGSVTAYGFRVTNVVAAAAAPALPPDAFPESAHPYLDNYDNTWTHTFSGSASAINVTFDSRTWVEANWDFIYVMDGNGHNIPGSPFSGTSLAGQTRQIPGRVVRIRLTSDGSITGYGFRISSVAAAGATAGGEDTTAEVGVEWINQYNGYQQDLRNSDGDAAGFYRTMTQLGATGRYNLGNDAAHERHFRDASIRGGRDAEFADAVDIAYFSGHGGTFGSGPSEYRAVLAFGTRQDYDLASSRDMVLGDGDLEWLVLSACETLKVDDDRYFHAWRRTFRGLHMILSFRTVSLDAVGPLVPNAGPDFADRLMDGDSISSAWLDAATNWFVRLFGNNFPAVMSAESQSGSTNTVDNDHWIGKGTVADDIRNPPILRIRYLE